MGDSGEAGPPEDAPAPAHAFPYLYNRTDRRICLPERHVLFSSTRGKFHNAADGACVSARDPGASAGEPGHSAGEPGDSPVAWPWRLRSSSWFTFDFGEVSSKDPVDFDSMFQSAREAIGERYIKVWAHNASDYSVRSSVFKRVANPHPRKDLQMQIVLDDDSASAFADGSALRVADLCAQDAALVRPVWNVVVDKREIKPRQSAVPSDSFPHLSSRSIQ